LKILGLKSKISLLLMDQIDLISNQLFKCTDSKVIQLFEFALLLNVVVIIEDIWVIYLILKSIMIIWLLL
jgi:hypothetical protein